jgi:acetyltransferase-like isoleucine patch superfamily enzyme
MLDAGQVANRWAVAGRHVLMVFLTKLPGTRLKTRLFRRLFGMTIGRNVGLAYGVTMDPYNPRMITIGDNVLIGMDTKIFVHVYTLNRQRIRPVTIGNNVTIGGFCRIAPGVTIGDGASIAPGTFVSRNVPAGAMVMPARMEIRRREK